MGITRRKFVQATAAGTLAAGQNFTFSAEMALFPESRAFETDLAEELFRGRPIPEGFNLGDEIITEGTDVSQYEIETKICRQLNLPKPEKAGKGLL